MSTMSLASPSPLSVLPPLPMLPGRLPASLDGVIFDCDGVLIDSREANAEYYNRILSALGLPPLTVEQEAYTYMATVDESLAHITPVELQGRLPDICRKSVNYMRDIMPLVRLEDGILDFLRFLSGRGVRCAVHTNRSSGMAVVVDTFDLHRYFDPVVTAVTVRPKPAPDGVQYVLQQWQAAPEKVLFVGDSLNDAQAALRGGVYFAAYRNPDLQAHLCVENYTELEKALLAGPLQHGS